MATFEDFSRPHPVISAKYVRHTQKSYIILSTLPNGQTQEQSQSAGTIFQKSHFADISTRILPPSTIFHEKLRQRSRSQRVTTENSHSLSDIQPRSMPRNSQNHSPQSFKIAIYDRFRQDIHNIARIIIYIHQQRHTHTYRRFIVSRRRHTQQ